MRHSVFTLRRSAVALAATCVAATALVTTATSSSATTSKGTVDVLYCGSFTTLMQNYLGPAFEKATGYTINGYSDGSTALAAAIAGKTEVGDVFISASPTADASLIGAKNGNWVTNYDDFATSRLVLGYNTKSPFAHDLTTMPWYDVVTDKGFLLGRTDPATDPKGVLAVDALEGVALSYDVPALDALATSKKDVYAETSLVGELQAGQLDAGFFYQVEASSAGLHTVALVGTDLNAQYTVARLNRAPDPVAAKAFVKFLLSAKGQSLMKAHGIDPEVPVQVVTPSA